MIGNILILDRESAELALLEDVLTGAGHMVRSFNDCELALRAISDDAPELLLLDIGTPGMNGFEFCRRIRQDGRLKEIPVIFLGAATDAESRENAFQQGGVNYLGRPYQKDEILARVNTHIALNHTMQRMRKTTEALGIREKSLKMAQNIARLGHWELNAQTGEMLWSDETCRILGFDPEMAAPCYQIFLETVHSDDRARVALGIGQILEGGDLDAEYRIVTENAGERIVQVKGVLFVSQAAALNAQSNGMLHAPSKIIGIIQDVSERKQSESELRRSEDNLIRAQSVAQIGSWHLDISSGRLEWTPEVFRIFGLPEGTSLDLENFFASVHPDDRERVRQSWDAAVAGAAYDIEHRVVARGEVRWVRERAVIERAADGRAVSGIGTVQDITERHQADIEIRRLERMFRSLAENLPDIICRFDSNLRRIYANPELERATGMPLASVLGKTHAELAMPESDAKIWRGVLQRVFSTGSPEVFEFEFPSADSKPKWFQVRAVPEYDATGKVETVLTIARDISTLVSTGAELRESEARLYDIAANVPGMVVQCCRRAGEDELWFSYVGNGAKDLLAIDAVEMLRDANWFVGRIAREHMDSFNDSLTRSELELKLWNWEGCVAAADGTLKWINLRATPHYDGNLCIWNGVVVNVTESKTNEKKLIRTQKMLRELAAHLERVREEERKSVAREIHDEMGQTLTALKMDVSLARLSFGDSNPALMKRLQSMTHLVERTLEIARHITSSLRPGVLDLGIVAALEWLVEEFTGYTGIVCELTLGEGEITLSESASTAVFRIVQESLTNIARHAAATRVGIIVNQCAEYFCVEVRDNGKGFDLHSVTGRQSFGLVGIRERMAMLEGDLTLESVPGRGTCIRACFPVVSS